MLDTAVVTVLPFRVEVDILGKQYNLRDRFRRYHGQDLISELLERAGLNQGLWVFRINSAFKASGHTPPIQVRHTEKGGVSMWVKPGSNDSGVKGTLLVTRDHGLSNDEVYRRLQTALNEQTLVDREREQPPTVDHVPLFVSNDDTRLLLTAVHEARDSACPDIPAFVRLVTGKMSTEDADPSYWLEALELLVDEGLLLDRKTHYILTPAGHARMEGHETPPATSNGTGHPPTCPVRTADPVATLLVTHKSKLAHLVAVADSLSKLQDHRKKLLKEIQTVEVKLIELRQAIREAEDQENLLTQDVDVDALKCLLNVED